MTQFVKPIADKLTTSWTGNNVGGSNLYQEVDETVASTDDFTSYDVATVAGNSDGPALVWKVTSVTTPAAGTATVRLRTYASQTCNYSLEIRSGYVSEANKGTLLGTTSVQNHPGDGAWHTLTDSAVTYAGGGDGTDLYFRLITHTTSGSSTTCAVTAVDADLPNADTTRNLSGTPDILATTPITGSGSGTVSWSLTDGAPNLTAITGSGTMTVAQGHHELSGTPDLTALTGTGTMLARWLLTGSPSLTSVTGAGTIQIKLLFSGAINLLPYFHSVGLALKITSEFYPSFRQALDRAQTIYSEGRRVLTHAEAHSHPDIVSGWHLASYDASLLGISADDIRRSSKPVLDAFYNARPDESKTYDSNTDDPGYTFVQPEQDNSAKRPCPAADPVNADGVRTERVSYYSRELKVIHE